MSLKQPLQYPVKYYSHSDASAPQMSNADGVIKTILKACLVTGYGPKAGAGWTALFDDAFRIILRRPLRTGNPPDIKIENGVVNSAASHRIVSQDDPTGLDDASELASVNLIARDSYFGTEWHLIVSDFGFLLCYQMSEPVSALSRNHILYVGGAQTISDSVNEVFIATYDSGTTRNGVAGMNAGALLGAQSVLRDIRNNIAHTDKHVLGINTTETSFNNDYLAQSILVGTGLLLPFYCAVPTQYNNLITQIVSIDGRNMLRYVNRAPRQSGTRVLYIPTDYWEL